MPAKGPGVLRPPARAVPSTGLVDAQYAGDGEIWMFDNNYEHESEGSRLLVIKVDDSSLEATVKFDYNTDLDEPQLRWLRAVALRRIDGLRGLAPRPNASKCRAQRRPHKKKFSSHNQRYLLRMNFLNIGNS